MLRKILLAITALTIFLVATDSPLTSRSNVRAVSAASRFIGQVQRRDIVSNGLVALTSGVPVNGSLPTPNPNTCVLSDTQYTIAVPNGASELKVDLNGNQDVDLFIRFGQPATIQDGTVVADFRSESLTGTESLTVNSASFPALQSGTYFVVVSNCGPGAANFTVTATVPLSCTYQLSPTSQDFTANGGSGSVNVITSLNLCAWSVGQVPGWITITSGSSGSGNGTFNYVVSPNLSFTPRSQTLTIAQQAFTVNQGAASEGGSALDLIVDDGSFEDSIGRTDPGPLYVVNRLTPTRYPATLAEVAIFFRNVGGAPSIGAPITILVGNNSDGDANINNTSFQITPTSIQALGQFNVYDVPDVTINSGDFVVGFFISNPVNVFPIALDRTLPSRGRSYYSTTDGRTFIFHDSAVPDLAGNYGIRARLAPTTSACVYTLNPLSQSFGINGGNGVVAVNTSSNNCAWTVSGVPNWITILSGSSGSGNGAFNYVVAANTSPNPRSGTFTIAGSLFTVTQDGNARTPRILGAVVQGKSLIISGENFAVGASLLMDGVRQKKVRNDEQSPDAILIAVKSGKLIPKGFSVVLQVENPDGTLSPEFRFTRP
ncbi:MAG: pre-peptidase C-terminal domain-containing protein [Acidobacteria bacterium]|nr:pre-peptidase C-terminal domain-containing protein [Acidobacteriota bacterium]